MTDHATSAGGAGISAAINPPSAAFSPAYRRWALVVLTLGYTMNYLDRQILSILLQPIKTDLHLTDTHLGFLSGITFALFYALLGVTIAMWADRSNRRNIIALAMMLFSGMTVLCGLVTNYIQLVFARIGVGVGEAGSSPPSHSMIADMFPPEERAGAIGIYSVGINLGILVGFLVGGWVSQYYGWRAAFFCVGAPGLIVSLLVRFTMKEPTRGTADGIATQAKTDAPPIREVFSFLWAQRSFRHIAFGCALAAFGGYASITWLPSFLFRSFHMTAVEIGTSLALIIGFVGGFGTYIAGWLADRLSRRDVRWNLWVIAIFAAAAFPTSFALYLSSNKVLALTIFVIPALAGATYVGPAVAMTQALVTLRMRAVASAILFFILNLIGMGLGPQFAGILSDLYAPRFGEESLRYALLTISVVWLWAAVHFILGARTLKADIERARLANLK